MDPVTLALSNRNATDIANDTVNFSRFSSYAGLNNMPPFSDVVIDRHYVYHHPGTPYWDLVYDNAEFSATADSNRALPGSVVGDVISFENWNGYASVWVVEDPGEDGVRPFRLVLHPDFRTMRAHARSMTFRLNSIHGVRDVGAGYGPWDVPPFQTPVLVYTAYGEPWGRVPLPAEELDSPVVVDPYSDDYPYYLGDVYVSASGSGGSRGTMVHGWTVPSSGWSAVVDTRPANNTTEYPATGGAAFGFASAFIAHSVAISSYSTSAVSGVRNQLNLFTMGANSNDRMSVTNNASWAGFSHSRRVFAPPGCLAVIEAIIVTRHTTLNTHAKVWKLQASIMVDPVAPRVVGTPTKTVLAADEGTDAYDFTVGWDANGLNITMTGDGGRSFATVQMSTMGGDIVPNSVYDYAPAW